MKKLLFLTVAVVLGMSAHAQTREFKQVLSTAGNAQSFTSYKAQLPKKIDPAANQAWWGYGKETDKRTALGTQRAETYDAAFFVAPGNSAVVGKTIKAIRLYLRDKVNTKDLKIWISKSLPADGSKADYVQNVDISSLNAGDEGEEKTGLANDIALTTPYTVGAEGVYVGYSLTITNALAVTKFPLVISDGNMQANSLFVRTSVSVTDWTDATGDFGPLYVWLLVENTDPAGIGGISENTGELQEVARYTVDGRRISTPQRGLNIVKMSDGSTAKVLVK